MNQLDRETRIIIMWGIAFSLAIFVISLDEGVIIPKKDHEIVLLQQRISDDEDLLQKMNQAMDAQMNATLSGLDAIRSAELDNYTMMNQISTHCFFKITGKNSSTEKCYGDNIVDERIQACMTYHNIIADYNGEVHLTDQANNATCTEMVKLQK